MKKAAIVFVLISIVWACSDSSETCSDTKEPAEEMVKSSEGMTVIDGVERSELALTMRLMYDQMKLVADSLASGKEIETNYLDKFRSIHTDHATEPKKIDETYQAMAASFLLKYEAFEASVDSRPEAFNAMLDACLACHREKCPGPIKAINKLKLN